MTLNFRDLVATAGLIHDIGKFRQRCGISGSHAEIGAGLVDEFSQLFPYDWLDDLRDAVGNHHRVPRKDIEKLVKLADWLASGERETGEGISRQDPGEAALVPITSRVELLHDRPDGAWGYRLVPLSLGEDAVFPAPDARLTSADYQRQWDAVAEDLGRMPRLHERHQLSTLVALLKKYASFIPSATPWEEDEEHRTLPDISLFDHLKVTSAVASALTGVLPDEVDAVLRRDPAARSRPICLAIRGDLSGIQSFIYRITEGGSQGKGTAKRLRGRSLYVTFLAEALGQSLLQALDLPPTNLLYCGGGRLDLLVPLGSEAVVGAWARSVEEYLLKKYGGTLGVQVAYRPVCPSDFERYASVYEDLDEGLIRAKQRRFADVLSGSFPALEPVHHVCPVCDLTPTPEASTCRACEDHHAVGETLPRAAYVVWGSAGQGIPGVDHYFEWPDPIALRVGLLSRREAPAAFRTVQDRRIQAEVVSLNDTDFLPRTGGAVPPDAAFSFRFLANKAPLERDGSVLGFAEIAAKSRGAPYLGLLKADVDRLGLVFRRGLGGAMSISRLATLSSMVDLFFSGWVGVLGERTGGRLGHEASPFYTMYAGGDDLLVVGPWDGVLAMAQDLERDFRRFCCENPNMTLSAAVECIRPHFPVRRFAPLLTGAIEEAKAAGRDRIRAFGTTAPWRDGAAGLENLLDLASALVEAVESGTVPRTLVHDLLRLHEQYLGPRGSRDLGWTYRTMYTLARRVRREVIDDLDLLRRIPTAMPSLRIPASYAILATRGR